MFPDTFHTGRLLLRPIQRADARAMFDTYAADPEVTRYLTFRTHDNLAGVEDYVAFCLAASPSVSRTYAMVGRTDSRLCGVFDLRRTGTHRVGFGYALGRRWWGQGLMTEALSHIADWALSQPDIVRIADVCDTENLASARVMEKAGFACEGVLDRCSVHPNIDPQPRDCFSYARYRYFATGA